MGIVFQCDAPTKVVEVGYQSFFNLSVYVSALCCIRLNVRIYECLTMIASIVGNVYINK